MVIIIWIRPLLRLVSNVWLYSEQNTCSVKPDTSHYASLHIQMIKIWQISTLCNCSRLLIALTPHNTDFQIWYHSSFLLSLVYNVFNQSAGPFKVSKWMLAPSVPSHHRPFHHPSPSSLLLLVCSTPGRERSAAIGAYYEEEKVEWQEVFVPAHADPRSKIATGK